MNPPSVLTRVWIASRPSQWEADAVYERMIWRQPVGYYQASRYAFRRHGECTVVPEMPATSLPKP